MLNFKKFQHYEIGSKTGSHGCFRRVLLRMGSGVISQFWLRVPYYIVLKRTLNLSWEFSAISLSLPLDSHSHQNPKEAKETMSNGLQAYMLQPHRTTVTLSYSTSKHLLDALTFG